MSKQRKEKILNKIDEVTESAPVEMMFRNGEQKIAYICSVEREETPHLYYARKPSSPDVEYGSKVDPRDFLPLVYLYELGYIKIPSTGQKISLMPFQKQ